MGAISPATHNEPFCLNLVSTLPLERSFLYSSVHNYFTSSFPFSQAFSPAIERYDRFPFQNIMLRGSAKKTSNASCEYKLFYDYIFSNGTLIKTQKKRECTLTVTPCSLEVSCQQKLDDYDDFVTLHCSNERYTPSVSCQGEVWNEGYESLFPNKPTIEYSALESGNHVQENLTRIFKKMSFQDVPYNHTFEEKKISFKRTPYLEEFLSEDDKVLFYLALVVTLAASATLCLFSV